MLARVGLLLQAFRVRGRWPGGAGGAEPVVGGEEAGQEAEGEDGSDHGCRAEDEVHHDGLDRHRHEGIDPGQEETGHGAGQGYEADGAGALKLGESAVRSAERMWVRAACSAGRPRARRASTSARFSRRSSTVRRGRPDAPT